MFLLYIRADVARELGIDGEERVSFGNSFHRDGGWAAAHYPQHYPGAIIDPTDLEKIRAAGKLGYVNVRAFDDQTLRLEYLGSGEEALKKVGLLL